MCWNLIHNCIHTYRLRGNIYKYTHTQMYIHIHKCILHVYVCTHVCCVSLHAFGYNMSVYTCKYRGIKGRKNDTVQKRRERHTHYYKNITHTHTLSLLLMLRHAQTHGITGKCAHTDTYNLPQIQIQFSKSNCKWFILVNIIP